MMNTRNWANAAVICVFAVVAGGCQIGGSPVSEREGYYTWVDEQGRVRYSPIVREQRSATVPTLAATQKAPSASEPEPKPKSESESESRPEPEDTEFTLENYPDGNELAKQGHIRPGDRQPYFTWRDAQGNVRVSYFRPDTRSDQEKGHVSPPVEVTPASVYLAGANAKAEAARPESSGEVDAYAVLGIDGGGSYLDRWREFCCQRLATQDAVEWQQGREFGVNITEQSPRHNFLTGTSPYQMIDLAPVAGRSDFIMRLRSYAKNGVFVPSLAFLNKSFEPVRLVTDLVSPYEPETWRRRGYLGAWVPVFPGQGERWLVLYTRSSDLNSQTVIETGTGKTPEVIPHADQGEMGIMMVESD